MFIPPDLEDFLSYFFKKKGYRYEGVIHKSYSLKMVPIIPTNNYLIVVLNLPKDPWKFVVLEATLDNRGKLQEVKKKVFQENILKHYRDYEKVILPVIFSYNSFNSI